jgi:hypothetical protein
LWWTARVDALVAGLIGIAATLLGSLTTYLFQSRSAEQAQAFERGERRRQEQADACAAFAAALTELKRGLVTLWFCRQEDPDGDAARAARTECDRLGAAAETAQFRVQMVCGDPELVNLAGAAFAAGGSARTELRAAEERLEAAVKAFISAASARFRAISLRPQQQRE